MPLGHSIFNYNKFCKDLPINIEDLPFFCKNLEYKDYVNEFHGHIITGDLNIIDDTNLRKFMSYGTKYRLSKCNNVKNIFLGIKLDIDKFVYRTACYYSYPIEAFKEWQSHLYNYFYKYISNLYIPSNNCNNIHKQISQLRERFVVAYIDKCASNYSIICKKYYAETLKNYIDNCNIFKHKSDNSIIINKLILALHKPLKFNPSNLNFPYVVLIPKMHKNPISFRTVTVGVITYSNIASIKLLKILNNIRINPHYNKYFTFIKNSYKLVDYLKQYNKVFSISTYDFKDLFNNINVKELWD